MVEYIKAAKLSSKQRVSKPSFGQYTTITTIGTSQRLPVIMDAPEDRDLTLQRASADLLAEFSTSLHKFLYITPTVQPQNDQPPDLVPRKCVRDRKVDHLVKLVSVALHRIIVVRPLNDLNVSCSWSLFRNGRNY